MSGSDADEGRVIQYLIAHRGGVVDAERSENSFLALEEAIRRGYTHVEIDARIAADGNLICFHNDDLMEEAGVEGRISTMLRDEVTEVVHTRSGECIPTFDQYLSRCVGRIGVMVDLKGCPLPFVDAYADGVITSLSHHDLLDEALILIDRTLVDNQDRIAERFLGRSRVSWRRSLSSTRDAVVRDPAFVANHYIFNHGADFNTEEVDAFRGLGLSIVASINTQHYAEGDSLEQGSEHIRSLTRMGVDGFQIDSCYDGSFFGELS